MSKVVLDEVISGYGLSKINENFQKIEDELNNKVLYRDNPVDEINTIEQDLDLNGFSLYNVEKINNVAVDTFTANVDVVAGSIASVNTVATNIANVNIVAGIDDDVTAVAAVADDVALLAPYAPDVGAYATGIYNNLASEDDGEGASLIGYRGGEDVKDALDTRIPEIGTYSLLRAYTGPMTSFFVRGRSNIFDRAFGQFVVDASDTTSDDNDGTIIVDAQGRRWKRVFVGEINACWFGNDGAAIQAAINAAATVKAVYIPHGDWPVSQDIIIPNTSAYWGLSIRGEKPSQMYELLSSSRATVLRATAAITCVLGNRASWTGNSGYYNKVKDIVIDGNNLANYGYVNGYQDALSEMSVNRCVIGGIICGELTNSTHLQNVTATHNRHGLILTGGGGSPVRTSTLTFANNCRFRQNTGSGVVICQTYGVKFDSCIIESNTGPGVSTYFSSTGEDYASPLPFTGLVTFFNSYWENNGKIVDITSPSAQITDLSFERCSFTGKNAVDDFNFLRAVTVNWRYCRFSSVGGFTLGTGCSYFDLEGYQTDTIPARYGANAANFGIRLTTSDGSRSNTKADFGKAFGYQYTKTTTATLTPDEVSNTVIRNTGQAAEDVYLTLPGSAMLQTYGGVGVTTSFIFIATTTQAANRFEFNTPVGSVFIFKGVQRTKVFVTSLTYGMALKFTFVNVAGTPVWFVEEVQGTWSGA